MNERFNNLLVLARRALNNDDNAAAANYYEQILIEDPSNWEAAFYTDYCKAASCVIRDIGPAAQRVKKAFSTAFELVQNDASIKDKNAILYELCDKTNALLSVLSNAAYNHYMQHSSVNGAHSEYQGRVYECGMAACLLGDKFYNVGDKRVAALCYKKAIVFWKGQYSLNDIALARIKEYEPDFQPSAQKSGCYVATAVYGSYDCPQVWTLRRYRDNILAKTWYGRTFIKTYYAISPTLVKWFGNTNWFKNMWRGKLDHMVKKLQSEGVESTPYEDKVW
jgi:hypothetical protein